LAIFAELAAWAIGLTQDSLVVVGASGGCMGVLIAFAMSRPQGDIIPFPLPFPINVKTIIMFVIFMNMIAWIMGSGWAVFTHFGGMGAGWLYMKGAPKLLAWREERRDRRAKKKMDHVGDAVDNIFNFDPKDKKH
jgi:membrane associated rhomboid family serine protease